MSAVPEIEFGGERLQLLPQRVAFAPAHGALLVADAHLGKAVSFRRWGVPVPAGTTAANLVRLDEALAATGARQLIFLGDLLHSARALAPGTRETVAAWRAQRRDLVLTLLRGNHDRHAGDPPADWDVQVVDEPFRLGALALAHHPEPHGDAPVVAGHLHPGITLGGRARERLRLPCFHVGARLLVLPAFGEFTGLHIVQPAPGERVFAVAPEQVVEVTASWAG